MSIKKDFPPNSRGSRRRHGFSTSSVGLSGPQNKRLTSAVVHGSAGCWGTTRDKTKKVGIGQITMHNREYLVALKAYQKGFLLIRLHYADELRNHRPWFKDITDGQVPKDQL